MSKSSEQKDLKKIDGLIAGFSTAALVTVSRDGELRSRPMTVAGCRRGSVLYFFSRAEDEKLKEIIHQPRVNVVMQKENICLSVSGRATISVDRELFSQFWSPAARLWFPEGINDPQLRLVTVEPVYAECWDRSGIRKLEFWWEAGKALVSNRKSADEELSGHAKIKL